MSSLAGTGGLTDVRLFVCELTHAGVEYGLQEVGRKEVSPVSAIARAEASISDLSSELAWCWLMVSVMHKSIPAESGG
jgi:hypothetical protein